MARTDHYKPGIPSWVDLASPDPEASRQFYGALFGWTGEPAPEPEAMGYTVFMIGDDAVAGLGPTMGEMPTVWNAYITVADVDATAAAATAAGGAVLMEPMDVLTAGRMAVIADPPGAALSLWQPKEHIGAELRMVPNALCWVELNTRQPEAAADFFNTLFGWEAQPVSNQEGEDGPGLNYTMLQLGEDPVGGIITMDDTWPADVPPHWLVYFGVEDCDAAAERVAELGGQVCVAPTDIPPGRFAVVNDPHGAIFTIISLKPVMFPGFAASAEADE